MSRKRSLCTARRVHWKKTRHGGRDRLIETRLMRCARRDRAFGKHVNQLLGRLGDGGKWGLMKRSREPPLPGGCNCPIRSLSNCYLPQVLPCTLKFFWDSGVGLSRLMSFLRSSSMVDLEVGFGDARRSLVEARSLVWAISLPSL